MQNLIDDFMMTYLCEKRNLVGVSGGCDSMALLDFLVRKAIPVAACYVNHQQRPIENNQEKEMIQNYCRKYNVIFYDEEIALNESQPKKNRQAYFREKRYDILLRIAKKQGYENILTAHHLNDQVETQLMRLVKGYELESLTGIADKRLFEGIMIIRPLLHIKKAMLYSYCQKYNVPYQEDSSNKKNDYFRNQLRNQVIPLFLEQNQQFNESFFENISTLLFFYQKQKKQLLLQMKQQRFFEGNKLNLSRLIVWYQNFSDTEQREIANLILKEYFNLEGISIQYLNLFQKFILSEKKYEKVTLGLKILQKRYGFIELYTGHQSNKYLETPDFLQKLQIGNQFILEKRVLCLQRQETFPDENTIELCIPEHLFKQGVFFRKVMKNDFITLEKGHKKLRRIYIDQKIPRELRGEAWVLALENNHVIYDFLTQKQTFAANKKGEPQVYIYIF